MKNKDLNISIPSPCTQPWEQMTADGGGRFCSHCQKTVIDFTTWSDAALHKFLQDKREKVCGRFLASQLNRSLSIPPQPHSRLYQMVVALGLVILAAEPVSAQLGPPMAKPNTEETILKCKVPLRWPGKGILVCEVRGDRYLPLRSAVVWVSKEGKHVSYRETDESGIMQMLLEPGLYSIRATYLGYKDTTLAQTISIQSGETTVTHLDFSYETPRGGIPIMSGEVIVREPEKLKAKRIRKKPK